MAEALSHHVPPLLRRAIAADAEAVAALLDELGYPSDPERSATRLTRAFRFSP